MDSEYETEPESESESEDSPLTPLHKIGLEHDGADAPVTEEYPETKLNKIGLQSAARTGSLFQIAKGGSVLYADAASPDYLEPQKHPESYEAAWKWAAAARAQVKKQAPEKEEGDKALPQQLTQVSAKKNAKPCPWYGCADGSNSIFQPAASVKGKQQSLHLAHGFGTTNAYTAKPLNAAKNQYYAGDHSYFGSERPVTSHEGVVNGKEAYSNDMQPAYDLTSPTSFDSVPLAEPSSFLSRVAKDQPQGDGKLEYNEYRFTTLSNWRKYEHGLSKCMQAEATLDPTLKDYSCSDIQIGLKYLKDCMQHHSFGMQSLEQSTKDETLPWQAFPTKPQPDRDSGAWGVLPELIQQSYELDPEDYHVVYSVLSNSAVFTALWRMENLHIRCVSTGSAQVPEELSRANQVRAIDREIYNIDRSLKRDLPGTPSMQIGEARLQGAFRGTPWEHAAVQRGAVRNYWAHVASTW